MPSATGAFSKQDIGGEILPILTTGLYQDSLDALREYVQNAVDANSKDIEIVIDPDVASVSDTGTGMDARTARLAIRLGISEKDPTKHVGFRGIGIYSGFNLCNTLEIYTKCKDGIEYMLQFRFGEIRKALSIEAERRRTGKPPQLFLEELLSKNIAVTESNQNAIEDSGTKVLMRELVPDAYLRLQKWTTVENYLQQVVPLPFRDEFRFKQQIEKRFREADYRIVPLTLQIQHQREQIFRPYTNDIFSEEAKLKFFPIGTGSHKFGFAWVCINDRVVLPEQGLRGMLIKKAGFSIGTRAHLESYFKRPVFNRRVTGEVIVQHARLLPNAARSDFEHNSVRQSFYEALARFITTLSLWGNKIQQEGKAKAVLAEVNNEMVDMEACILRAGRDKDELIRLSVELADAERRLKLHQDTLKTLGTEGLNGALSRIGICRKTIRNALNETNQSRRKLEAAVAKLVSAKPASSTETLKPIEIRINTLAEALDNCGVRVPDEAATLIRRFEEEFIFTKIEPEPYKTMLTEFVAATEDE